MERTAWPALSVGKKIPAESHRGVKPTHLARLDPTRHFKLLLDDKETSSHPGVREEEKVSGMVHRIHLRNPL